MFLIFSIIKVVFDGADVFGGVQKSSGEKTAKEKSLEKNRKGLPSGFRKDYVVQCFPIYSLLLALGNPTVDYFSLDVGGNELDVLKTIPFGEISISVGFSNEHLRKVIHFLSGSLGGIQSHRRITWKGVEG